MASILPSAKPLAFPGPGCVDVSQTCQNSKVLGLNGLKHNGAGKMDFNLVVTLPTRRLRVPLEMPSLSNHQCKSKLKLVFLSYSEAAKAVAKTAVMVNTVGPWCPKLDFLVMFKPSKQKIYARDGS